MSKNLDVFLTSLCGVCPPRRLPPALAGLWLGMKGKWGEAHEIVDEDEDWRGALVHAWLLRSAGDQQGADYWYERAGVKPGCGDVENEARCIASILIDG